MTEETKDMTAQEESIDIIKLKAQAYDQIAQMEAYQRAIQQCQQNINKINEQIAQKTQEKQK